MMKEIASHRGVMAQCCNSTATRCWWSRPRPRPLSLWSGGSAAAAAAAAARNTRNREWRRGRGFRLTLARNPVVVHAESSSESERRAEEEEMSLETALELLGVSQGSSFDEILRAKKSILSSSGDDPQTTARVEAAYDMLLMQSLTQRRAGKVVSSSIRYADVKPVSSPGLSSMPQWLQSMVKNVPISFETPSARNLGIQAGLYGTLMVLTYANGVSTSSAGLYAGADVPGVILATSFGASLYFLTKKNIKPVLSRSVCLEP